MLRQLDDRFLAALRRHARAIIRVVSVAIWGTAIVFVLAIVGVVPEGPVGIAVGLLAVATVVLAPLIVGLVIVAVRDQGPVEDLAVMFAPVLWLAYRFIRRPDRTDRPDQPEG